MDKFFYSAPPAGAPLMSAVAQELMLRKAGIDPRTPAQRTQDEVERRAAVRAFDRYPVE